MEEKELRHRNIKTGKRERRQRRRKKVMPAEKLILAAVGAVLLAGAGLSVYFLMPGIKVAKQLKEANAYLQTQNYEDAFASYEEALSIDSSSVKAYRAMAGAYLTREDTSSAERILFEGWETTQDEGLLQYYCTVLLNEAVADINSQSCTLETLDKCISVLEKEPENKDGYKLFDVCYERLFGEAPEQEGLLCNTVTGESCGYRRYQDMLLRLLLTYEETPSDALKAEIIKLAAPGKDTFFLDVAHLQEYHELLKKVEGIEKNSGITELLACTEKAAEVQSFFKEAFTIFESGDFAPIKEFMNTEAYLSMRDEFIEGTMEYWEGKTYIPVSREKMKLIKGENGWKFAFLDYEEYPETKGIINVWGTKYEDAGVQRVCISYEPASADGEYYPHTTYEFTYLYSNVQIGREYVPQMNYRFETRVATPEGTNTQLIGDWGGAHEWRTEF